MKSLNEIREWVFKAHADTNHLYGEENYPYSFHLEMVAEQALNFISIIPEEDRNIVLAACYCHDSIEDARLTYNDLIAETGSEEVAEIVYAVTNEKGRTRKDRANDKYYSCIRQTPYASFVKLCDRVANTLYSKSRKSSMYKKYKAEMILFLEQVKTDASGIDLSEIIETLSII